MAARLELQSLALVRTLASGTTLSTLFGDRAQGSLGAEEAVLLEARLYLEGLLATAAPEIVSRHSFAETARLEHVSVLVARADLPRRLALTVPVQFACLVLPAPDATGSWVVVPAIDHTFFLRDDEELAAITEAEIRRVVLAKGYDAAGYLALLPAVRTRLERMPLGVTRQAGAGGTRTSVAQREARKAAFEVLKLSATPVHETEGKLESPPVTGREREKQELATLLAAKVRGSVLLVGDERAGKSALLADWMRTARIEGKEPVVFATSGARLIAGMSGFGQWQERVRRVLEAAHTLDAILWFPDLADLFSDRAGSSVDVPSAMRRFLDEGKVRVVAEVKADLLERLTPRNAAFFSCFSHVRVGPMEKAEAARALDERADFAARHEPEVPALDGAARAAILELGERYEPYASFPGKAIRLADDVRSAAALRLGSRAGGTVLGADAVYDTFSRRTGIPAFLLRDREALRTADIETRLRGRVIGQEHAVRRVSELLSVVKAGLAAQGKPLATLLFVGPTGVGKTELARALAELLFGDEERLIRFDMSEYADAHAAERLFRGNERGEGLLTRAIRQRPFGVVLLDEVEKAHPAVFDLLLQVCGEGRLTDGRGRTAYFHNAIVVMTSNLGATQRRDGVGFAERSVSPEDHYAKAVAATFRPEFVGRLDRVVAFRGLTTDENVQVARLAIERVVRRAGLVSRELLVHVSEEALRFVAAAGTSDAYGARALKRHVERVLGTPLGTLAAAEFARATVYVELESAPLRPREERGTVAHGLRFGIVRSDAQYDRAGMSAVNQVVALRRPVRKQLALPVIDELREELAILVTELGQAAPKEAGALVSARLAEHARLAPIAHELEAAHAELCAIEELVLVAYFTPVNDPAAIEARQREVQGLRVDAEAASARFHAVLAAALVALYPLRNAATLLLSELDGHGALELYLAPLLRQAKARSWKIELHVQGEGAPPATFGPVRTPAEFLATFGSPDRSFRHVLVHVVGENAGAWLALEAGLHQFVGASDGEDALLFVRLVARRAALTEAELAGLGAPLSDVLHGLRKLKPVRSFEEESCTVRSGSVQTKLAIAAGEYWQRFEAVVTAHLLALELQPGAEGPAELEAMLPDDPTEKVR